MNIVLNYEKLFKLVNVVGYSWPQGLGDLRPHKKKAFRLGGIENE
jgi:hypothetical protein